MGTKIESSDNRVGHLQVKATGLALPLPQGLTVEFCLHLAIVAVGLLARLAALGAFPLLGSEANTALAAWRGAQGKLWRPELYSPLLYDVDLMFFSLVGGSDVLVRTASALAGAALVALPYMARDVLGRPAALAAAILLALSPTWLFFSRTADGQILAALATGMALLAWWRQRQQRDERQLRIFWIALALGLVSGAGVYTPLLAAALGCLLLWLRARRGPDDSLSGASLRQALAPLRQRPPWLVFIGVLVVLAGALGLNPSGLGAVVSLAGHWIASLWPGQGALSWYHLLRNLATYELLIVVLALLGAAFGLARRDGLDQALVWWAGVALLLGTLLGHRDGQWMLCSMLPLTLLAARGMQRLGGLIALKLSVFDWAMLWAALCLCALVFFQLAAFTQNGQSDVIWLAGLGLGLVVLSLAAYGFWLGGGGAARVSVVLLLVLLSIQSVHTTVSLSYRTGRQPHEILVSEPTAPDMAQLSALVKNASLRMRRDEHAATVQYDAGLDPLIGWYLRELPAAESVAYAEGLSGADMLITTQRAPEQYPDGYAAQPLTLATFWPKQDLTSREKLRWLIYRDDVGSSVRTEVQLWIKLATAASHQP